MNLNILSVCPKNLLSFAVSFFVVLELHSSVPTKALSCLYWFVVVAFNSFYVSNYSFRFYSLINLVLICF